MIVEPDTLKLLPPGEFGEVAAKGHDQEKLARYKVPKYVELRAELPKTAIGKLLRRALRKEAKK
ncbi:hypothetical protein [Carboxydothermus pertinax]|uniref:Long-chain fatty acid--CoA ligase n=1 Tax=Carboxydothermus pertinax TaxID=870242 RepID=A0A1L8CW37_9THEO|nr:hypothetical protein [Carboxydothermus pertinax]GAV23165.1 long-chain fatty acid--CoA ligase [Carboxydothermus pertinax]